MFKKNYILKGIVACMVMLAFACHKDYQTYDYKDINNPTIQKPKDSTYALSVNDSLIIKPVLKESMPGANEYGYSWAINDSLVSTQKELRILVNLPVKAGYNVVFKAVNKKTGAQASYRYALEVRGQYYAGWFIAHNQGGKAHFSFLRADDVILSNPAEEINKKAYPGTALGVYMGTANRWSLYSGYLMAFTTQGFWRFERDNLKEVQNISYMIPSFTDFPIKPAPYQSSESSIDQWVVMNGGLYVGYGPFVSDYELEPFSARSAGDYDAFPGVFMLAQYSPNYIYDNKNKRFMTIVEQTEILRVAGATLTASFNFANVGRTLLAHDVGGGTRENYFVMSDANGRYLMSAVAKGSGTVPDLNQRIESSPDIDMATKFLTSTRFKLMYYAANNKIYLYDIAANSSRLIYNFPAGYVIKDMKKSGTTKIVVATNLGANGEIYYFDLAGTGDFIDNTYAKKFTGFGDIVQITAR